MGLLFISCEKVDHGGNNSSKLVGTWDKVEESGDYIVITKSTITFYYADNDGFDNGTPYKYEYEHPHLFIAGINVWDVVSFSRTSMVWQSNWGGYEKITLKKRR